jgi:hypothetical protein
VKLNGCEGQLFQVVLSPSFGSGLANTLDCGKEKADQDGDDGDNHQQLD